MLYEHFVFFHDRACFCCSATDDPSHPPVAYADNLEKYSCKKHLEALDMAMVSNQQENKICRDCKYLIKQSVPKLKSETYIKSVVLSNFTRCNSKCVYCDIWKNNTRHYYDLLPILKQMNKDKAFDKNCQFDWGGGEPLIHPEFNSIFDFLRGNNFNQLVNSSGLTFSERVLNGLKDKNIKFQISPDSGTAETYFKVKNQKGFDVVWNHIKKYCKYPENLKIKYIMFALNNSEKDVRGFIDKCVESNVKNIEISVECHTIWQYGEPGKFGELTQQDIDAAALMLALANENNIKVRISSIWGDENIKSIKSLANTMETSKPLI